MDLYNFEMPEEEEEMVKIDVVQPTNPEQQIEVKVSSQDVLMADDKEVYNLPVRIQVET